MHRNFYVRTAAGAPKSWADDTSLKGLTRSGILKEPVGFSCLAAQAFYYKNFYKRPQEAPLSIEELVINAVKSISALNLRQARQPVGEPFPKEAAFQQLFHEAATKLLPPQNSVCPELNTFVQNADKTWSSGELDFYINTNLKYAIELSRLGHKVGEHVESFDPKNGKYHLLVQYTTFLVVDYRGPKTGRGAEASQHKCILYFSADFSTVTVKMRLEKEELYPLQP